MAGRQAPIPVASGTGRPHAARPASHPENKEAGPFYAAEILSFPQGRLRGSPPPLAPPQGGWPGNTQRTWDWGQGGRQGRLWDRRPLPPPPLCRTQVKEYDSISRLDQWLTTMLLRIKKTIQGDEEDLR